MILDTSVIVDILHNKIDVRNKISEIMSEGSMLYTTVVTAFELGKSTIHLRDSHKTEELLDRIEMFNLDRESARMSGIIFRDLKNKGLIIDPEDCMIAGIALTKKQQVLTKNRKHFERIDGLKVVSY